MHVTSTCFVIGGLRLADESLLTEKLGVTQGSVTALSLHNDTQGHVRYEFPLFYSTEGPGNCILYNVPVSQFTILIEYPVRINSYAQTVDKMKSWKHCH